MGKGAKDHGGRPALGGEAWGRAVRSKDVAACRAKQQWGPAGAREGHGPCCCCLSRLLPPGWGACRPGAPPTSPLVRASLPIGTASDGLGPEGQACLWREVGVSPLIAGAHPDLLTLTWGRLPPLSLCPTQECRPGWELRWGRPPSQEPPTARHPGGSGHPAPQVLST